jgi:hypothetical protein
MEFTNAEPTEGERFYNDDDNELIAFCTECLSQVPDAIAERDIFLQRGHSGVCPMCQGPTVLTSRDGAAQIKRRREMGMRVNPKN